jgi:hypothetical protein
LIGLAPLQIGFHPGEFVALLWQLYRRKQMLI